MTSALRQLNHIHKKGLIKIFIIIAPDNSKNTNHGHISLIETDHCNSTLSTSNQFEKGIVLFFLQYFRKPSKNSQTKGRVLEGLCVSIKIFKIWGNGLQCVHII